MRWAVIGAISSDSFEFHLHDTLNILGHEVKVFDLALAFNKGRKAHYWLERYSKTYDKEKAKMLANSILRFEPDIVLAVYRHIHPLTIELLKQARPSLPVIHVNQDNLATLEQQQVLASDYDFLFTKDPYMARVFKEKAGLNAYYLPESFNPRYHSPPVDERIKLERQTDIDVLVFGTLYPYRNRFLEQIIHPGRKVKLYGTKGPFFPTKFNPFFTNQIILGKEKSKLIFGSRIILNNFFYGEIEGVNCKYFEINGIGGFQICDYKNTLREYSPIDPVRYAFQSACEANDLIDQYLTKPELRYEISEKQRKHFLDHHTYEHRIQSILEIIGYPGKENRLNHRI